MPVTVKRNQSLWLLITIAFAIGGCGGKDSVAPIDVEIQAWDDLRREIREVISDPVRQAEAIKLLDVLAEDVNTFREVVTKRHKRVRELNADYDTPRAEFESFLKQVSSEIQASQQRATATRQAFLAVTTAEEWSELSKVRSKAMTATIKTMQAI